LRAVVNTVLNSRVPFGSGASKPRTASLCL